MTCGINYDHFYTNPSTFQITITRVMKQNVIMGLCSLALATSVDTALCVPPSTNTTSKLLPTMTVSNLANTIFRAEGGSNTKYPYGIMLRGILTTDHARFVCILTVQHAWKDFEGDGIQHKANALKTVTGISGSCSTISLPFIQFLGSRYCPPSVDPVGHRNWTNNVWRIINKRKETNNENSRRAA